jgi:hypothetical protein
MIGIHMESTPPRKPHPIEVVASCTYPLRVLMRGLAWLPTCARRALALSCGAPSGRLDPQAEAPAADAGGGLVHVQRRPPHPVTGVGRHALTESEQRAAGADARTLTAAPGRSDRLRGEGRHARGVSQ